MAEEQTPDRKAELDEANQLKDEVMLGLQVGEPAERLLLKAVHALALMDHDTVSFEEAKRTLIAIYGDTLGKPVPLEIELEEFTKRLKKIKVFYEEAKEKADSEDHEDTDTVERALNAIRAHERRIAYLKSRLGKTSDKA
ncbi:MULTISPECIES: hypothetical protein [Caproicibacterium]|uniref:Uncharacterized protein n=1 Tax=Caproicibacterium argilliputei TaxID=3030016 RepID=A0AA97DCY6_9FIRM|nr:hypothetical protein [Caproicibacterium argilliputei]WOC33614.1 hypothetical protein PXC00_07025 [Caproicibacterium argilliputei]